MKEKKQYNMIVRRHISVSGIVQGVGFRPFVYRLALELSLSGWVRNTPSGVEIELEGDAGALELFYELLNTSAPPLAVITSCHMLDCPPSGESGFSILPSGGGTADIQIPPDSALCPDCLGELLDPSDRRYLYPFITCTNCGPRYSIITGIPYDRPKTTMADFPLCPECKEEYENPADRRFHAQPLACPVCGPQLALLDEKGMVCAKSGEALYLAKKFLAAGKIVAIKGLGGYHLAVDATNHEAVARLRQRKKRYEKPFAVMVPTLSDAADYVCLDRMEERLLSSPEAPIVILHRRENSALSPLIAPGNGWLGVMLPYTPLHHLLFHPVVSPPYRALVMTSANSSDEPIIFQDDEAVDSLSGIADYILSHNRPIHTRSDDSVLRLFQGKPLFYRRSRGYAPRGITLPFSTDRSILAVGAELKSAIALTSGNRAVVSQYIGDLQNDSTVQSFKGIVSHLSTLLQIEPEIVACDLHPDYLSSLYAAECGLPVIAVQHHHAHLAACMAENGLDGDVIGLIFDGTGYGSDGTLWGGEFLVGGYGRFERAGHFRPARLPGGDAAVKQPWRMACSYLFQSFGKSLFDVKHRFTSQIQESEQPLFLAMLERGINAPLSSSCGRLFDAVASILHLRQTVSYDGQAAIELEALAESADVEGCGAAYPFSLQEYDNVPFQLDFSGMFPPLIADYEAGVPPAIIAYRFHGTIAAGSAAAALRCAEKYRLNRTVLSGGVFQNRLLTEMLYTSLTNNGLQVFTHRLTPPNDGCIPLGQSAVAGWKNKKTE